MVDHHADPKVDPVPLLAAAAAESPGGPTRSQRLDAGQHACPHGENALLFGGHLEAVEACGVASLSGDPGLELLVGPAAG